MFSSDQVHLRELRLMAKKYAERGEKEKADQAMTWSDQFAQFSEDRTNVESKRDEDNDKHEPSRH